MPRFLLDPSLASLSDHAECRAAIRVGSRSFYAASRLLPAGVRRSAFGLYAFCRLSDDAVDLGGGSTDALERLRDRLARAAEGRPLPCPADRAMADLMRRHAISRAVPEALLEGFAWDAEGRTYDTLDGLLDYAARVAGAVGVMMTLLMGERSPEALARAADLGVAMQLTNIARDVGEDAQLGNSICRKNGFGRPESNRRPGSPTLRRPTGFAARSRVSSMLLRHFMNGPEPASRFCRPAAARQFSPPR